MNRIRLLVVILAAAVTLLALSNHAMAAASCVIHQLGTTGTASPTQLSGLLFA